MGAHDSGGVVAVVHAWSDVVGAKLAAHSDVVDMRNGALYVAVDHPAWLQLMQMRSEGIRKRLAQRFPELALRELCLFAGQPQQPPSVKRAKGVDEAENEPKPHAVRDAEPVTDPELAATLKRIEKLARERRR